jgi:hypothetical protein
VFEGRAIIHPPSEAGGRPVCLHSFYGLTPFLRNARPTGWDAREVPDSDLIAWRRGEPGVRAP